MATLASTTISRDGILQTLVAANAGGDEWVNDGEQFIAITNGGASPITLTAVTQSTVDGQAVGDRAISIGVAETKLIGPFQQSVYNDGAGKVQLTYSAVTSVTIAIFKPGT